MTMSKKGDEIRSLNDQLAYLTEEIAYLKGDDIALIKRLIQLHIMISRQKREDAKIVALSIEEEEEEPSSPSSPTPQLSHYKYHEPSVDDVEREAQQMTSTLVNIITRSGPHPVSRRKPLKQTVL